MIEQKQTDAAQAKRLARALACYELTGDHHWDSHRFDPNADCPACAAHRILIGVPANVTLSVAYRWLQDMVAHLEIHGAITITKGG